MFELQHVEGARLWMPPPAAMETVMELFNEDRIAHPWNPHVFAVPRLMTHLWRKNLFKGADLHFTVTVGEHFWSKDQHEPLIIAVVLPRSLTYLTTKDRGLRVARGTHQSTANAQELERGFKLGTKGDPGGLHAVDGVLRTVWESKEGRSRRVLQQFLAWARKFPPVQKCLVRGMLHGTPRRPLPKESGPVPGRG
ncbi:hypothetical protein ACHAXR_004993 [Thalassiosira sp. AJA248-18]